jgi:HK97 family phage major capsid protein
MSERLQDVQDLLNLKAIEQQMLDTHKTLEKFIEKSNDEIKAAGTASAETKSAVDRLAEKAIELGDKIADLEQKQAVRFDDKPQRKSPGELLVESDEFKSMLLHQRKSARVEIKTAIVSDYDGGMSQPMVAGDRLNMVWHEPNRQLRIRDILPKGRTTSNTVFFPKEGTFTSAAAVVVGGSPTYIADNVSKPEAALTFTSDSEVVCTIAHWIPVSKQAMDDSAFLAAYVNSRLMYGLKLKEETELLTGTGLLGTISGINTNSTAYAQAESPNLYSTDLDFIADAIRQAQQANYEPNAIILNPRNAWNIYLSKGTDDHYLYANPTAGAPLSLWGKPVVVTNSQTAGTFTVLDTQTFMLVDREDASVSISYEEGNNFTKNMVTVLAEERICLLAFSTSGCIKGTF